MLYNTRLYSFGAEAKLSSKRKKRLLALLYFVSAEVLAGFFEFSSGACLWVVLGQYELFAIASAARVISTAIGRYQSYGLALLILLSHRCSLLDVIITDVN